MQRTAPAFPEILRAASLFLFVALVTGCTSNRAFRISPLANHSLAERSSGGRVNLWPLAYHDGSATSVLWPLFDVDERGFALRPLVAKDDARWSVLYPLSSWDENAGTGWALLFYRFEEHAGLFPIARIGSFSYVGPVWWKSEGGRVDAGGLFPIVNFGTTNWVGPLWWWEESGRTSAGLFPVALLGDFSYAGPVWWTDQSAGVFPLLGLGRTSYVGPAWWSEQGDGSFRGGLFPLFHWGRHGDSFSLLPFYAHDIEDDATSRYYLLGLGHTYRSDVARYGWLLPLYFDRRDERGRDTILLPFFWHRARGEASDTYTLLGNRSRDDERESFNVYPLWWSHSTPTGASKTLLPLFHFESDGERRTLLTLLGGRSWGSAEDGFVNFLGPLFHHSRSVSDDEEHLAILWPLYDRHRRGEERTSRLLPLYSTRETEDESDAWYALGIGHRHTGPTGSSARLFPFYSSSSEDDTPDVLYGMTLYGSRTAEGTTKRRLFPLYWGESSEQGARAAYLLGLGETFRTGGEDGASGWRVWPLASASTGDRYVPSDPLYALTLVGRSTWEGGSSFHLGASLLYRTSESTVDDRKEDRTRVLGIFTHELDTKLGAHVPQGATPSEVDRVERDEYAALFGAAFHCTEAFRVWPSGLLDERETAVLDAVSPRFDGLERQVDEAAARTVLSEHGYAPASASPEDLRDSLLRFTDDNARRVETTRFRFPLVMSYEDTGDSTSWSGPLWLVTSESSPEKSSFDLLYYAYRSETVGERTTRDIFPFVTWDTGPDEWEFSFLWRLLHFRRDGEARGGHLFFLPFGDV